MIFTRKRLHLYNHSIFIFQKFNILILATLYWVYDKITFNLKNDE